MLKIRGTKNETKILFDQELEKLRLSSLYLDGRTGYPLRLYHADNTSTQVDVHFYCVFTTKPHFLLRMGNPFSNGYTYLSWNESVNHEELIATVYQSVLENYPELTEEKQLSIVSEICKVCYEELSKFDSDVQQEYEEEFLTVKVIRNPHLCLEDNEYIEAVCRKKR
jgi:hypothetical protein